MTPSLLLSLLWVLAATVTAFLPMRRQVVPGITLLVMAPVLIGWIGHDFGLWAALAATAGFVSMFRNPLRWLMRKALGRGGRGGETDDDNGGAAR
jgi:hypothetical protein